MSRNINFIKEIKKNKIHLKFLDKFSKSKVLCVKKMAYFFMMILSLQKVVKLWSKISKKNKY